MTTTHPPPSLGNVPRLPRAATRPVIRIGRRRLTGDLYHFFMVAAWSHVFAAIAMAYVTINVLFACVYLAGGDSIAGARRGSFADAFFFSVQTFATIGYGSMVPKTTFANVVVTVEAFIGLLAVAMATGLLFSKFSRPTARVLFSQRVVIGTREGKPTLRVRMANQRDNDIVEASFRLSVLLPEVSADGERMRRIHDLALVRSDTPIFTITFTATHVIDATSPLAAHTAESLETQKARFIVTLTGIDGTTGQTIHARHIYEAHDVAFDARFVDILSTDPDGRLLIDYTKFHEIEASRPSARVG
ncbi:MAG: ion channel [Polyangiaceae bacterium]